jgi:hypothetical protein
MRFYCWHDTQAGQLRFSLVSACHAALPFECPIEPAADLAVVIWSFLGAAAVVPPARCQSGSRWCRDVVAPNKTLLATAAECKLLTIEAPRSAAAVSYFFRSRRALGERHWRAELCRRGTAAMRKQVIYGPVLFSVVGAACGVVAAMSPSRIASPSSARNPVRQQAARRPLVGTPMTLQPTR